MRLRCLAFSAALAASLALSTGTSLAVSGGYHTITHSDGVNNYCWASSGGLRGRVVLWGCNGSASQRWYFSWTPAGYLLQNEQTGLCADVQYNSTADGAALIQYYCNQSDTAQLFDPGYPLAWDSNIFSLRKYGSNQCVDDPHGYMYNGIGLDMWACFYSGNEFWAQDGRY